MIEIKTVNKGAELVSIKFNGEEKMHDGESFWNRHSPVLFPIVGKLKRIQGANRTQIARVIRVNRSVIERIWDKV